MVDLFRVEQEVSVGSNAVGPSAKFPLSPSLPPGGRPDALVVVEEVGEVVLDEVFAGHPQVHGIPVGKLLSHLPAGGGGGGGEGGGRREEGLK